MHAHPTAYRLALPPSRPLTLSASRPPTRPRPHPRPRPRPPRHPAPARPRRRTRRPMARSGAERGPTRIRQPQRGTEPDLS